MKLKLYKLILATSILSVLINSAWAQIQVRGKVTDAENSSTIPGVNIVEKGTTTGTVTDADGNYYITVKNGATLIFTFVGFQTKEVVVSGQTVIDVSLSTDVEALFEVVVVGYGEVKKKDLTGAVATLSSRDFNKGVMTSPQDLILGRIAGVSVTSNSGQPGAGSTIRIRGGSSINANNDPLIIIDGFPMDNTGLSGSANLLSFINPNDIETYTVLKDASATAIYGSRASNGVIIITTKKGKSGKPQFSYNGNFSLSTPVKYMDVLDGDEYRALVTKLAETGVSGLNQTAVDLLGTENTDWQKEIFRDAFSQDHNLSASGAFKKLPYRVSYGYTDQQGILLNTGLQRNSLNVNLTPTLFDDHLKLTINAKGSYMNNNFGESGAVGSAISFDPTRPVRAEGNAYGGYYSWLSDGNSNGTNNPVAQVMQTDNKSIAKRIIANLQAEYKLHFLPDLRFNVNVGIDKLTSDGHNRAGTDAQFTKVVSSDPTIPVKIAGRDNTYSAKNQSELLDLYLNYVKELGGHKIDLTAGYGWQHFYREIISRNGYADGTFVSATSPKAENFLVSFFGRLNYSYKGKYLLTATLRDDGSSRFADHWGLFPSYALAWKLNEESFLSGVESLSDLKLRVGYGETGQQDVTTSNAIGSSTNYNQEYYPFLATYTLSDTKAQYQLGNTFYQTWRPNAYDGNIKWETTATYNLGLDFGLFNDRITGSVEVYKRETRDALNYVKVPNGTTFSNFVTTNVGNVTNNGVEVTLKTIPVQTENLTWNLGFNFARNANKITKLSLIDDPNYGGVDMGRVGTASFIQNRQVNFPNNSFYVFQQVYDADGKPIEGAYVDRSGEGGNVTGSLENKYHYKDPTARILMGVNSQVKYKQIDFSFSGRVSLGNYVYNNSTASRAFYNNIYNFGYLSNIPKATNDTEFINQQIFSDYYVQDASFFKMDNINLGYSMDQLFNAKLRARIGLTVQNAFIITKYNGIDPEVDGGIDNNIYPRPRVYLMSISLTY